MRWLAIHAKSCRDVFISLVYCSALASHGLFMASLAHAFQSMLVSRANKSPPSIFHGDVCDGTLRGWALSRVGASLCPQAWLHLQANSAVGSVRMASDVPASVGQAGIGEAIEHGGVTYKAMDVIVDASKGFWLFGYGSVVWKVRWAAGAAQRCC